MIMAQKPTRWSLPVTIPEIACCGWPVALCANVPNPNIAKVIIAKAMSGCEADRRKYLV
jgi:hypothetical protein